MTALWILFSSFCSASILACIQSLGETLAFVDIAFVEFAFVLSVTTVIMLVRGVPFRTHVWPVHLLRSVVGIGVAITQILTVTHMPVAAAQTLQYTSPLFVAGVVSFVAVRKKEHVDWRILVAIVAAFIGICIMFHPSVRTYSATFLPIGLLCGLLTAVAILLLRKLGTIQEAVPRTVFYFHLHGTLVLGCLEFLYGELTFEQLQQIPLGLMLVFLTCAQFARAIGWGHGNTFLGAVFSFSGVVFAAVIDFSFFGVVPDIRAVIGMLIIIAAATTCLILVANKKQEKNRSETIRSQSQPPD